MVEGVQEVCQDQIQVTSQGALTAGAASHATTPQPEGTVLVRTRAVSRRCACQRRDAPPATSPQTQSPLLTADVSTADGVACLLGCIHDAVDQPAGGDGGEG